MVGSGDIFKLRKSKALCILALPSDKRVSTRLLYKAQSQISLTAQSLTRKRKSILVGKLHKYHLMQTSKKNASPSQLILLLQPLRNLFISNQLEINRCNPWKASGSLRLVLRREWRSVNYSQGLRNKILTILHLMQHPCFPKIIFQT